MGKRVLIMLIGVFFMGISVQLLERTDLGPDPFSALNYIVSEKVGLSFGTYQLIFNLILFLFIVVQDKSLFGFGTIGNMLVVGYSADFTDWVLKQQGWLTPETLDLTQRLLLMVPALVLFLIAAALYMNCGVGTSPYDALPVLLHRKVEKLAKKPVKYRIVRICYDGLATLLGFIIGGSVGIVTVLMVFTLGPCVDFIASLVKKTGLFDEK